MDEALKKFSMIDGAFVMHSGCVIESASILISTFEHTIVMPSGFGTRHIVAVAISSTPECAYIVFSQNIPRVKLF
jgi:DNA integrity scanning protein DisA with diadenylate cyclase activity